METLETFRATGPRGQIAIVPAAGDIIQAEYVKRMARRDRAICKASAG